MNHEKVKRLNEISRLTKKSSKEFKELIKLFNDVFQEGNDLLPSDSYLENLLTNPYLMVYVTTIDNEIVGGLTAYILPKYNAEKSELFIYDIAVKPEFQRRGIGRSLISKIKEDCVNIDIDEIFVAANEEDDYALDFYRATDGRAEKAIHFTYSLKR
jgi:aminoglycoside 3-N-acetyltransferase I